MSLSKNSQLEFLGKIQQQVKSGDWCIESIDMKKETISRGNIYTGFQEHLPSGDIKITLHINDPKAKEKAAQFLKNTPLP